LDATFEYIAAVLIIFIMLGFTIFTVTSLTTTQLELLGEQQLYPIAQKALDKFILTRGVPSDWGADIFVNSTNLLDFGVASSVPRTDTYDLDANKVMRLVNLSTVVNRLYIDPVVAGTLMGLFQDGRWSYGFRFYMVPALNITVQVLHNQTQRGIIIPDQFKVHVENAQGLVARNAEVRVRYFDLYTYVLKGTDDELFGWSFLDASGTTNYLGDAYINFSSVPSPQIIGEPKPGQTSETFLLMVQADYYGLQSNSFYQTDVLPTVNLMLEGQYLIANYTELPDLPKSAIHPDYDVSVLALTNNLNLIIDPAVNVTGNGEADKVLNTGNKDLRIYQLNNTIGQDVVLAGLIVTTRGRSYFALASRPILPVSVDYRSHSFPSAGLRAVTIERYVHIGRNSFVVYFTIWRM